MTRPRVLVVQTGTTEPEVAAVHGDYDAWFCREFASVECEVVRPFSGEKLPCAADFDGVALTGSPLSVRDEQPWMMALGRWTVAAADDGVHVLAVCFGHQLVGEVLGGRVEVNPSGPERGTVAVCLTAEGHRDPLFQGYTSEICVQATHCDVLVRSPRGRDVVHLASNANTQWQAFRYGAYLRAVQFHPELKHNALSDLMEARGVENCPIRPTPDGSRLLQNWLRLLG